MAAEHVEERVPRASHMMLVSGAGHSQELPSTAPFSTEVPAGAPDANLLHSLTFHTAEISASPCRAASFPQGIQGVPCLWGSHGGHSAQGV